MVGALVAFAASVSGAAQPTSDEKDLAAWIEGEWGAARELPASAADCVLTYQAWTYNTADPAAIAALEREVAGHPEHPRRFELENMLRRRQNGPDTLRCKLWWGDAKLWRLNTSISYLPEMPYADCAVGPEGAWMLGTTQLTIIDPAGGNAGNYDAVLPNAGFQSYVNLAFHGGFDRYKGACQPGASALADDGRWSMEAASKNGAVALVYRGRWRADLHRGFVDSIECVKAVVPSAIGERWEFADWELLPAPSVYAARTVKHFEPRADKPRAAWQLLDCVRVDREKIEEAAAVPRADGVDIERGKLTYTRVFDARTYADLPIATVSGPVLDLGEGRGTESGQSVARVFGWVLAGGLIIVLIILKSRSRNGTLGKSTSNVEGVP